MLELVRLETVDFEISISARDVSRRQELFFNTKQKLGTKSDVLKFEISPPQKLTEVSIHQTDTSNIQNDKTTTEILLHQPLFFENTLYRVEIIFLVDVEKAETIHRSRLINDGFGFVRSRKARNAYLSGVLNTGNDIGWFNLPIRYQVNGKTKNFTVRFEILPTKMDLHADLPAMYEDIDREFPLWRYSAINRTEQNASKTNNRGNFPLLWLSNFKALRASFEQSLKIITQAPHARLQTEVLYRKADKLKGRHKSKLSERVREDIRSNNYNNRYRIEQKRLSVDTPENQFIKSVVQRTNRELYRIEALFRSARRDRYFKDISDSYLDELRAWQQPLNRLLKQSFLKDVSAFNGLSRDSLVLQQKTGYSGVYSVWLELKFYLDAFANQSTISMKSVAEVYEVWCFLEVRRILIEDLGFEEVMPKKSPLELKHKIQYQLKGKSGGAFDFVRRSDNIEAKLLHEAVINSKGKELKSYAATQKPDIMLELHLPQTEKKLIWLFDAKYRIKIKGDDREDIDDAEETEETELDKEDLVPADALNQMHRYRDALIRIASAEDSTESKSRPVVGAFALYPGFFDQISFDNPYEEPIREVGIGAFPLLPSRTETQYKNHWLKTFLESQLKQLATPSGQGKATGFEESLFVEEPSRIPYHGMTQVLYNDLTLTASLGSDEGRSAEYFERFRNGTARAYHIPTATFGLKFQHHIANEIRFLALMDSHKRYSSIEKVWQVKSVSLVKRKEIPIEKSGKESSSNAFYYLFELGFPLVLPHPIPNNPQESFRQTLKLTTLELLENASNFSQIERVYANALS